MKRYLITYHAPPEMLQREAESPDDSEGGDINAWEAWAKECGDALADFGSPANPVLSLGLNGEPRAVSSEICGYSILQAESKEKVMELMQHNPHLRWDKSCWVDIHELLPV